MILFSAILLGLMGSFHCAGMCGPIALAIPLNKRNWVYRISSGIIYNTGRILTYSLMGALFGFLGHVLNLAGFQRWISMISGIIMITSIGISLFFPHLFEIENGIFSILTKLRNAFGLLLKKRSYFSLFTLGLLNGFLPCGLVYIAVAASITTSGVFFGSFYMFLFGMGTIPMMLFISLAGSLISLNSRIRFQKAIPYLVVLIGLLFILRGLSLGIPYISPDESRLHPAQHVFISKDSLPPCCKK
jgi:sulfite exporter TauE/SafE